MSNNKAIAIMNANKLLYFVVFAFFSLGIESKYFQENYFDGRIIINILFIFCFGTIFYFSDTKLKKLLFVMVILSYIGELIFCELVKMYDYRLGGIPLYIPFGHAIVYATGYSFAQSNWAIKNELVLRKVFTVFFVVLFAAVGIFLNDIFSVIAGSLFFLLLRRKKWQNLYYFLAICAIFVELVGTSFKCWRYESIVFGIVPSVNPPVGAVFIYAGGDVLLAKIVSYWKK